jgi:Na+-transporting NADH:ubiquinone oxidoreductase subunit A
MKSTILKFTLIATLALLVVELQAQSPSSTDGSSWLINGLIAAAILLFFYAVISVSDNLLIIEAKNMGVDTSKVNMGLFPSWSELVGSDKPDYTEGRPVKRLTKGHDIKLSGAAAPKVVPATGVTRYAVQPTNFLGLQPIPKMEVEVGDTVRAGDPLFFDKQMPEVKFVAPVSGEVIAINRGEKRSIVEVVILADREQQYRSMEVPDLASAGRAELMDFLAGSGGWTLIRQRPFNALATPGKAPRDIFVSTFDTGPLAPDLSLIVEGNEAAFQKGIDVLSHLTDGRVHLGLDARNETAPSATFLNAANAEKYFFKGPHPAGNVGVQIHHIAPVSGAAPVWTLGVQEVIALGKLFTEGRFDGSRVVALTGNQLKDTHYVKTYVGANVGELVAGNLKQSKVRLISGDVLSGQQKSAEGFMDMYDDQLTAIEEGDQYELFGWLLALEPRPSVSRTYLNFLFPNREYEANTNTHGEKRAFVVTNDYEAVMPMDIYTHQLMKSIVVNDLEKMEGLGILELVEEDVALCEFACVSKQPLQKILREGLDALREQG